MEYQYFATFTPDPDDGIIVTFADVPEANTHGKDHEEAVAMAREGLGLALRMVLESGRDIPPPGATSGVPIAVDAADALKIAVITAFRRAGISKVELARRLGKRETEARRILDPDHPTGLPILQAALAVLGQVVVISVKDQPDARAA